MSGQASATTRDGEREGEEEEVETVPVLQSTCLRESLPVVDSGMQVRRMSCHSPNSVSRIAFVRWYDSSGNKWMIKSDWWWKFRFS